MERGEADIHVTLGAGAVCEEGYRWLHSWLQMGGESTLACARRSEEGGVSHYLLRFPGLADFVVRDTVVECYPQPDCQQDLLRHLVLDQVLPRLWAHRGHLVLHASAVQLPDDSVVAFLGESGWGKSTLAAALRLRGCHLLGDDSISLSASGQGARLHPAYCGVRLNEDSIAGLGLVGRDWAGVEQHCDKRRFELTLKEPRRELLLDTLFVMQSPSRVRSPSVSELAGSALVARLIKGSFLLDVRDTRTASQQLELAVAVLERIPRVFSLSYAREYEQLSNLCEIILGKAPAPGSAQHQ